jgi:hypothetical protein
MEEKTKSDFFIAMSQRICDLRQRSIIFSLISFSSEVGKSFKISVAKGEKDNLEKEKTFNLTFDDKKVFFLNDEEYLKKGGRPTLTMIDMIDYLLVLVNGKQVYGTLMVPGFKQYKHLEAISPT